MSLHAQLLLEGHPEVQAEEQALVLFKHLWPGQLEDQKQGIRLSVLTLHPRGKSCEINDNILEKVQQCCDAFCVLLHCSS